MEGLDLDEFADAMRLAPLSETAGRIQVGFAYVLVAEFSREEVADALGSFRGRCEEPDRELAAGQGRGPVRGS